MAEEKQAKARALRCIVVSDTNSKTRVGKIERMVKHKAVGKYIRRSTKVAFHDEENQTKVGDEVLVTPSRPLSATKRFRLLSIIKPS